jgi:hypothetical protein
VRQRWLQSARAVSSCGCARVVARNKHKTLGAAGPGGSHITVAASTWLGHQIADHVRPLHRTRTSARRSGFRHQSSALPLALSLRAPGPGDPGGTGSEGSGAETRGVVDRGGRRLGEARSIGPRPREKAAAWWWTVAWHRGHGGIEQAAGVPPPFWAGRGMALPVTQAQAGCRLVAGPRKASAPGPAVPAPLPASGESLTVVALACGRRGACLGL